MEIKDQSSRNKLEILPGAEKEYLAYVLPCLGATNFNCIYLSGPLEGKQKQSNDPEVTFSYHTNTCLKRTTMRKALEKCSRSSTFRVTGSINLCASNSQRASVGPKGVTSSLEAGSDP